MTAYTATAKVTQAARTIVITDESGTVTDKTRSPNNVYVAVWVAEADGKIVSKHGTKALALQAGGRSNWVLLDVQEPASVTTETDGGSDHPEYADQPSEPDGDYHPAARKAKATAPKAPKTGAMDPTSVLPEGAVTDSPKSGSYLRVKVNGKPIGYVSPRKAGQLIEVLTSRLEGVKPALMEGTRVNANQTALLVMDAATARQATALLAHAASTVPGASA